MRLSVAVAAVLLWQSGPMQVDLISADPQQMRYERQLALPTGSDGWACAVLDADVFAHAASRSSDDLRVFRSDEAVRDVEVPFAFGESEAQPDEVVLALPSAVQVRGNRMNFNLAMPGRAYSTIDLQLRARNFDGIATVTGLAANGRERKPMGQFPIFDRSDQALGSSTALPLEESRVPALHVELTLTGVDGQPYAGLTAAQIAGASVPPSREAQTLYAPVAATAAVQQRRAHSVALLHVPAHVPVERITFVLSAAAVNFRRAVTVTAKPDGVADAGRTETVGGMISAMHTAPHGGSEATFQTLHIDAALAATLRSGAMLEVTVDNAGLRPLPIQRIEAQMRQRTVCFRAEPGNTYTLRYGDAALQAAAYPAAASNQGAVQPVTAILGPERKNAAYTGRMEPRSYPGRHPELLWVVLIVGLAVTGATGMHAARQMGRGH